ncbi:MAG: type II secretion system protein [Limisphaerales bacterium]|jgi:prepilin-type N-terminal cleavage/methylation domain-containing protein
MKVMQNAASNSGHRSEARLPVGFTLIELLVVISVIGILASLIVGVSGVATSKARISQTQALLNKIGTAIDTYHADFGSFPPDARFPGGASNTATNQLFYELTGSVAQSDGSYLPTGGGQSLRSQDIQRVFGVKGFQNVSLNQGDSRGYLSLSDPQIGLLAVQPEIKVITAPIPWPLVDFPAGAAYQDVLGRDIPMASLRPIKSDDPNLKRLNPWHYRSSGLDRFNQQSYDLWLDLPIGNKVYRINNWSQQPKVYEALPLP